MPPVDHSSRRNPVRATFLAVTVGIDMLLAIATVFSAYGGMFNPHTRIVAAILAMVLPVILLADIAMVVVSLFIQWRLALVIVASWLIALPSLLVYSPVNFIHKKLVPEEEERTFTILTWNVLHFVDFRGPDPERKVNATLSSILATDADIVNLQELDIQRPMKNWHVTDEQIDSIKRRYPYRIFGDGEYLAVFSKFPMEQVPLKGIPDGTVRRSMSCYRIDIKGVETHLMCVHLQGFQLSDEEKNTYKEALRDIKDIQPGFRKEIGGIKNVLVEKLRDAFTSHLVEAYVIRQVIDSIGGPFIVAGDFNDFQNSYAVRKICRGDDLRDAYADGAAGPSVTYHDKGFWFRIDQMLYRGPFEVVWCKNLHYRSSDHSPLEAKFLIIPQSTETDK